MDAHESSCKQRTRAERYLRSFGRKDEPHSCFGDDIIDIDMFRAGGYGVAVANSNPRLLAIADEVCDSNNDDGVASWLQNELL